MSRRVAGTPGQLQSAKSFLFPPSADGASAVILGRRKANIEDAAAELSKATGQKCLGIQADVRQLETLEAAVKQTVAELGRIDFVVAGAAGNFLAPIDGACPDYTYIRACCGPSSDELLDGKLRATAGLSSNAFRTVLEIDTIGTYNTFKATVAELLKTRGSFQAISATLHYKGMPRELLSCAFVQLRDIILRVDTSLLSPTTIG